MNGVRSQSKRRRWLSIRRLLCAINVVVAVASCTFPVLVFVAYRQARIEREIVADLLAKSSGGSADVDSIPTWQNRLYDLLGIPRPVTWLVLRGPQINDHDLAKLKSLRSLQTLRIDQCPI